MQKRNIFRRPEFWLFLGLAISLAVKFINLGHEQLTYWDEAHHAIVARNLLKHPLKFTLYDDPWLNFAPWDWGSSHLWLHKPPLALWQVALSYVVFGINTFALRLPSAILSTGAAFLTYRIGVDLFRSKSVGLIAASLQAFNPFLMGSIHGYYFSDHIDVALLFWTELGFWALVRSLRSGLARYYVLAGLGLGLAFLTKVFLAFIIAGVSVTFWVLKRLAPRAAGEWNINVQHLALTAAAALAVVLPWVTYTYSNNPTEFKMNVKLWLLHLTEDMEHWAAPWDRHLFDYMIHELPWIYTLVILGLLFVTVRAVRGRFGEMFLGLWAWGALIPFSLALSKTPADTLIALPALLLAFARVLEQAFRRDNLAHTSLWAAAALAVILIPGGESVVAYRDALPEAERSRLGSYLIANFWVVKQLLVAAAAFVALVVVQRFGGPSYRQRLGVLQVLLALPVTLVIAGLYVVAAGEIIAGPVCRACPALGLPLRLSDSPSFRKMGSVIQETFPKNAVFIMDSKAPFFAGHHFSLMFWSDRSVYHINQLPRHELAAIAMRFQKAGGVPFLVSDKVNAPAEPVGISENGFKIYRLQHPLAETQSKELTSANP